MELSKHLQGDPQKSQKNSPRKVGGEIGKGMEWRQAAGSTGFGGKGRTIEVRLPDVSEDVLAVWEL